jgi:hypothetical protein
VVSVEPSQCVNVLIDEKVAVGLTDVASRLAISCFKLYEFWESLQGAPTTVEVIKTDLVLLSNVLQDLSAKGILAPSVSMVLKSCQVKVEVSLAPAIANIPE